MPVPVILHVPHSSERIPREFRGSFVSDIDENLRYMTDRFTDELFDLPAPKLIFPISRLICDVERFRDDAKEEMSLRGMGVCYTRSFDGKPLRRFDEKEKDVILERWYDPHHAKLDAMTETCIKRRGKCTIIDCHSFSPVPLPYEPDQNPGRPDICIGTDPFHTPPELRDRLAEAFRVKGFSVSIDSPYSGAIVPLRYYRKDPRVRSVMIEINRGLYLDDGFKKSAAFRRIKKNISEILTNVLRC